MDTNPNHPQTPGPQQPAPQNVGPQDGLTRPIESAARPSGAHARPEPGQQPPVPPAQIPPVPPAQIPPGGPSGRGGPAEPAKPAKQRSTGKLIGLVAAGIVALLVIVLVGSELYIRNHYQSCIADNIKTGTKANDVKVSFEKTPMLIQNARGKIPSVDIQIDGFNGVSGMSAHAVLKGVTPSGDNKADDAVIVGSLTLDGIKNQVLSVPGLSDPTVTLKPSENKIEVTGTAVILPVTVNLSPSIKDNKVEVTASKTTIFGVGIPDELVKQLVAAVADLPTPKGMTVQNLKMTDSGITLEYVGQNVPLNDLGTGAESGMKDCSIL
ncbi:LmeA family phospholipid-binding protein [Tsukamurella spumae]|uniref:DUF2993 domain-containing protein n=1 Tax=Tsukamurella spumae TaxID=44753 RepID=A0A846X516_9ACTN|nr:DUF2993 domain-containing protein [Tsukamurella spumae]NKY20213.1 DUF2993 domain-containing protein [Tsukamurella spumae]